MNEVYMEKAVDKALTSGYDMPIGAVLVKNGEIIAVTCNTKEKTNDVTAHAEILAIRDAQQKLNSWRLSECELYVTLEPCPMCAWAIIQSGIKALYFGSYDTLYGAFGSKLDLKSVSGSKIKIKGGIMEEKCDKILKVFFKKVRDDNKKQT